MGKQLRLMEIRFVISQIVHIYDISFAPGQTPEACLDGLVDGFMLMCPKLELDLRRERLSLQEDPDRLTPSGIPDSIRDANLRGNLAKLIKSHPHN